MHGLEAHATGEAVLFHQESVMIRVNNHAGMLEAMMNRLPKGSVRAACAILDQAVLGAASFAMTLLLNRMGESALAFYFLGFSLIEFFGDVSMALFTRPYLVFCHRLKELTRQRYLGSVYAHFAVGALAIIVLLIVVALVCQWFDWNPPLPFALLIAVALCAPARALREQVRYIFFAKSRAELALALDLLMVCLQFGLVGWRMWLGDITVTQVVLSMAGANVLAASVFLLTVAPRMRWQWRAFQVDWVRNWRFAYWGLASLAMGQLFAWCLPWCLRYLHGLEATALLGLCYTLMGVPGVFSRGMTNFLTPRIFVAYARGGLPAVWRPVYETSAILAIPASLFFLLVLVTGDSAGRLCYQDGGIGSGHVLLIMAVSSVISSLCSPLTAALQAGGRPREVTVASFFEMVLSFLLLPLLLPTLGVIGAAWSAVISQGTGWVIRYYALRRLDRESSSAGGSEVSLRAT